MEMATHLGSMVEAVGSVMVSPRPSLAAQTLAKRHPK